MSAWSDGFRGGGAGELRLGAGARARRQRPGDRDPEPARHSRRHQRPRRLLCGGRRRLGSVAPGRRYQCRCTAARRSCRTRSIGAIHTFEIRSRPRREGATTKSSPRSIRAARAGGKLLALVVDVVRCRAGERHAAATVAQPLPNRSIRTTPTLGLPATITDPQTSRRTFNPPAFINSRGRQPPLIGTSRRPPRADGSEGPRETQDADERRR